MVITKRMGQIMLNHMSVPKIEYTIISFSFWNTGLLKPILINLTIFESSQ